MIDLLFQILLGLHIVVGGIGLLTGTLVLLFKKGDQQHKKMGKLFAVSMLIAAIVALILSSIHPNYFLFTIGVFTIYLVATGLRYLRLPALLKKNNRVAKIDWFIVFVMTIFTLVFMVMGILLIRSHRSFGWVLISFGMISSLMLRKDVQIFTGKPQAKHFGIQIHLQRMTGAYIASATAFLVVNNTLLPSIIAWLLPTVILTPLIIYWSRKF